MSSFRTQIFEDMCIIKDNYMKNNPFLSKDEYTFNYWVLIKLFNVDEEIVEENATEYSDNGIDCYVFFEDSKELFIIQNKFYDTNTNLSRQYVIDDFLIRPVSALNNNNYKRSAELQDIFNKYKDDNEFRIHLNLYITNDIKDASIIDTFRKYQNNNISCYLDANIYYLSDIQHLYFDERKENTKNFSCDFLTINDGTVLNINKENYNLPNLIDAKYILTPVGHIFDIVQLAKQKEYSLFAENIREYLGNKGINAKMAKTLEDKKDRSNFFYYNNGITVICDKVVKENSYNPIYNRKFSSYNPQIVNGCQTVNTIYEVLRKYKSEDILEEFKDTFVMVKLLVLSSSNSKHANLYENIVKYNNSQNAITEKAFAANKALFFNMQKDFEQRGFLLSVKQSDNYYFKNNKKLNTFRPIIAKYEELFGMKFDNVESIIIPLEKLLQVILAFSKDGYYAFTKKSQVLKHDSIINTDLINFIKSCEFTIDDFLKIYLLFLKAERKMEVMIKDLLYLIT